MSDNWCAEVEQGAVLLTVNQRLSRHYVRLYSQQQLEKKRQWWETPEILPLSAWLKLLHASCVADGSSAKTLLPDIAAERTWQQVVAADAASSVLLDSDLTASNAQRAWRVSNDWALAGTSENDQGASEDHRAFARWRTAYINRCVQEKFIDSSTLADHLRETLSANSTTANFPKSILLAGFLTIPEQLQSLLGMLKQNGVSIRHIEPEKTAQSQRLVHADDDSAYATIALQTRQNIEKNPSQQMGVVVHDLQQRRAQVLRAFDNVFFPALSPLEINAIGRPYDLSIGLPLNEQSVVRTALLFLTLLTKGLRDTELSAFLLSPYLPGTEQDIRAREKLDRKCRDNRIRQVSFYDFIALLPNGDALKTPLKKVSKRKWKNKSGAAIWAENFGAALRDLGWPGSSIDSEEYQTVEAWNACLDDFQTLDDGDMLNDTRALGLLTRLCKSRVFQLETDATPIQIMGRLESHGLSFDKLWVTGLDADQWPPVSVPTSFIPIQQQQAAGVPDSAPALRLSVAEQEMALWQRSTDELFLCHAKIRDGLELTPASIVADILVVDLSMDAPVSVDTAASIQASAILAALEDTHGPELVAGTKVKGGTRLLENQSRCPFKAFALHRLGIKKLEEAGIGLDPRQHGNLFHYAMEIFWEQVRTHPKLIAMSTEELDTLIHSVIERSMQEYDIAKNLQDLQSRHLYRLINDWVTQVERGRQSFSVVELEQELDIDIAGVGINVKVDRVDKLATGQTVVIDYKTGSNNTIKSWGEPRIENPQLPLYAGTDEQVEGICFAQVAPNQLKFIGTTSEDDIVANLKSPQKTISLKQNLHSWDDARAHWAGSLNMLATEIREGLATITPVKNACEYCELPSLCRIDQGNDEAEDLADEPESEGRAIMSNTDSSEVNIPADASVRDEALDPSRSFIVQAPAGSGKTELLTRRVLRLLTLVDEPEEVLSITFTRKAASEMRARVVETLQTAATGETPTNAYQLEGFKMAQQVLARDKERNWQLLQNTQRLNLRTVDALCTTLAHRLPVVSELGGPAGLDDKPRLLYRRAAEQLLDHRADELDLLLLQLGNRQETVQELLADLLGNRDQWGGYVVSGIPHDKLRELLESKLQALVESRLEELADSIPAEVTARLTKLLSKVGPVLKVLLQDKGANTAQADALCQLTSSPGSSVDDLSDWIAISNALLTANGAGFRKPGGLNRTAGFPTTAKDAELAGVSVEELQARKEQMIGLLEDCAGYPELVALLAEVRLLPSGRYADKDWALLSQLLEMLPALLAELQLVFAATGKIDFVEMTQRAQRALGTEDEPTDLALALDMKIKHLLVDEFQDTSRTQFDLYRMLVAGWQPDDGRTFFAVGDPMQSIYRFREGDVTLFAHAQEHGVGEVQLNPLTLTVNFRAAPAVVDWVNESFSSVFPDEADAVTGAVPYAESIAHLKSQGHVELHPFVDSDVNIEANHVASLTERALQSAAPDASADKELIACDITSLTLPSGSHIQSVTGTRYRVPIG